MIPNIPRWQPPDASQSEPPVTQEAFSVRDGLAWLGISLADYERANEITAGRHGNPFTSALLDARAAQANGETPETVLSRHGIDPAQPLAAVREYDQRRSRFDN
jgi:thymidylate synthase